MKLFNRTKKNPVIKLMADYINSVLPEGVRCGETGVENDTLMLYASTRTFLTSFNIEDNYDVEELSDADKEVLNRDVIIPMLKEIDDDLKSIHGNIKQKLKDLGVEG